jgi:uncharacterized protein (TIGR02147 family)
MLYEFESYRLFLREEWAERAKNNSRYSLRAFARQIGVSPTTLSHVISGKKNLSLDTALEVASRLGLNAQETEYFELLVQIEAAKTPELRARYQERLRTLNPTRKTTDLTTEFFKLISDWHHYGILMLTEVTGFEFTPKNVARRIGISAVEAKIAIDRLYQLELLEDTKTGPRRSRGDLMIASQVPNTALRKYHRQLLERAIQSLETQTPQEKLVGSEVLAVSKQDLPAVEELMEEFFSKVIALSKKPKKKTDVYHLGVQFFNLTQER